MAYTTIDDPTIYFQNKLYTGNGSTQSITLDGDTDMQPDWVWIKSRSDTYAHILHDSARGATKELKSSGTNAEGTDSNGLTSFDSDGFSLGTGGSVNNNNSTYVAWNWKTGTAFSNDVSSTSVGTIDSAGSVNDTAGFSIIKYTGNGTSGATTKHGLSTKPDWMIVKNRDEADSWQVYHHKNTSAPATETIQLNETGATSDTSNRWNDTEPTTTLLTLGDNTTVNKNTVQYVGYIFSEKKGYSKFGTYTGNNNADGTFVNVGFKPAWVMVKSTSSTDHWRMHDNKRIGSSGTAPLYPHLSNAEPSANFTFELLSNGFKWRNTDGDANGSNTYIYMAFAESPFVNSKGVPNNAE